MNERDPGPLGGWLDGVRYPNRCLSTNSMGQAIYHGMHRMAAEWHARRYLAEHGRLPEGVHHVTCFFARNGLEGDLKHPCPGYPLSYIRADMVFPPAPPLRTEADVRADAAAGRLPRHTEPVRFADPRFAPDPQPPAPAPGPPRRATSRRHRGPRTGP
jgi:hypothetical protein